MPPAQQAAQETGKHARTVVSIPGDLVAHIDRAIHEDGGEALAKLGLEVESMRQGFVHKLLREGLASRSGNGK